MRSLSFITPGMGAYWLKPFFMYSFTSAIRSGEQLKSGKPCARLIAPCSWASALITLKIVVPTLGSFDLTDTGNSITHCVLLFDAEGAIYMIVFKICKQLPKIKLCFDA